MSDEMILVPRAELLAWAQDWLRENDPGDDTDVVTPFDTYLLKTPVRMVGCEGGDGLLRTHPEAETCDVCAPKPESDWVLVPREATPEMWEAGMNCHSPDDTQGDYLEKAWDAMLAAAPQPPAEAHCATCSCVPGMTPAVRFDATPAEKDGAVRDHLIRMGWTPPAEAQPVAWQYQDRDGKWHGFTDESHRLNTIEDGSWPVRALYAHPPPSAPVGVDGWVVETVEDDPNLLVINTPNKRSWIAQRGDRVFELAEALALAQQPAAVGEVAVLRGLLEEVRSIFTRDDDLPDDLLPRIDAALAAQQGDSHD